MRLSSRILYQLAAFGVISVVAVAIMFFSYMRVPSAFFGVGHYTVTVQLPEAAGLYATGNVTYRGVAVGRVKDVRLTHTGVEVVLSLNSDVHIPADLNAEVHSVSAVGEQYVALLPRSGSGPPLKNGDVIPVNRTSIPPNINSLLAAANRGLQAIPRDNLKTVVDEGYEAVGGLGPELSRLLKSATTLSSDSRKNLDSIINLIDESKPLLDSQIQSSDAIKAWAAHLAIVTTQLQTNDSAVKRLLQTGSQSTDEVRKLIDRLQPTLPTLLANLVGVGDVGVTYRGNLESLLVQVPQAVGNVQGILLANANTKQDYVGAYLSFNLNLNIPPPCTTGFLPAQQQRSPSYQDAPDVPKGAFYCRIPQDSPITTVRGARNLPCETRPGKRAPTVKMCESEQEYIPLNDGFNWKGDPNETLSGQDVPQLDPGDAPSPQAAPAPPPLNENDPAAGVSIGPDRRVDTPANPTRGAEEEQTWQSLLMPPMRN